MRLFKDPVHDVLDVLADANDSVQIEVQKDITGGKKVYVHVNGVTVFRMGAIMMPVTVVNDT